MPGTTSAEPWEYSLQIPNDPKAVPVCRRTLRLILTVHGLAHLAEPAELITSELVSNAVLHTKGPAIFRLRCAGGVLRMGAWDADPEPPEPPDDWANLTDAENGRGTALVRAFADVWGWHPLARFGRHGKFVWCELEVAS
ncbi:ATP-binding protein [Streptomyces sp. NPDC086091]|uniref:ATP-binding protein n=1 Tax=Streptomyces sp. NPDC086091 TaxID=3365751 RepID=UPI0038084DCE